MQVDEGHNPLDFIQSTLKVNLFEQRRILRDVVFDICHDVERCS